MMEKKILILGYFGYVTNQLDGQTIKTRNLLELVRQHIVTYSYFDTQYFKVNKLSLFRMFWEILKADHVFYLPAHKNLRILFPMIYIFSLFTKTKIDYFIVGGWLVDSLKNKPIHRIFLKNINSICSETQFLKQQLESLYGLSNVTVFPNFRFLQKKTNMRPETEKLRLVFMSRVTRMKGLDVIATLCEFLLNKRLENVTISFYGPINRDDKCFFDKLLDTYSFVSYNGIVEPQNTIYELSKYDALILPTRYYTEGLPGAIVEAYLAGIPVIVTNWKYANEFVVNYNTGIILPFENPDSFFIDSILYLAQNKKILKEMKKHAKEESHKYSEQYALSKMKEILK